MSSDTKWIIGTVVTLAGVLSGLMLAQFSGVNGRIDELRSVVRSMDERLRVVEVGLAEVKVRLQAVENGLAEVRVRVRAVENGLSEVRVLISGLDERLRAVENGLAEVVRGPEPGAGRNPAGP